MRIAQFHAKIHFSTKETKMSQSNSKLSAHQKTALRAMRLDAKGITVVTDNFRTVIAYQDAGNGLVKFSASVMSPDENKFRFKVGEYHARRRMYDGESAILPCAFFENMCDNETLLTRDTWMD